MDKQIRRIGVLTSGGDAPGMNALIRSVVRSASANDISVLGIRRGYSGLINGDIIEMGARSVDGIIRKGGTMLYTARCKEMLTEEGLQKAADTCRYLGIDGLICCGGDGTFRGAQALSRKGVPCIGVPGTIDNDIGCSDYTIGFDTACNTAIECIDKLTYRDAHYRFVPDDYEKSDEEKQQEKSGELVISYYGSDEVEDKMFQSVFWEQDGVTYLISGYDTGLDAQTMFDMAAELVK